MRLADSEIEFLDRDRAIRQVVELAEGGTWRPYIIYGPEGCVKTALLRQASEVLREHGYAVIHVNPMTRIVEDGLFVTDELRDLVREVVAAVQGLHWCSRPSAWAGSGPSPVWAVRAYRRTQRRDSPVARLEVCRVSRHAQPPAGGFLVIDGFCFIQLRTRRTKSTASQKRAIIDVAWLRLDAYSLILCAAAGVLRGLAV